MIINLNPIHVNYYNVCGGSKIEGTTTFFADLGSGVVVIRHVPALICDQCGADWIEDSIAETIEKIVEDVREKGSVIEMKEFSKIAS
jgi:YgiT-type zinc finger domain-containing protein